MSKAASSRYTVPCRACGAEPQQPCRTLASGRVTDTHQSRIFDQHQHRRTEESAS